MKSDDIGDPSLIGLSCETGEFQSCSLDEPDASVPIGCEGVLMFSDVNSSCGSLCGSKRRSSPSLEGWTKFFTSTDTPNGTGDHEHFFFYNINNRDRLEVYDQNGAVNKNCIKTAIHVRERETGIPWWILRKSHTLLFSEFTEKNHTKYGSLDGKSEYFFRLKPDSG